MVTASSLIQSPHPSIYRTLRNLDLGDFLETQIWRAWLGTLTNKKQKSIHRESEDFPRSRIWRHPRPAPSYASSSSDIYIYIFTPQCVFRFSCDGRSKRGNLISLIPRPYSTAQENHFYVHAVTCTLLPKADATLNLKLFIHRDYQSRSHYVQSHILIALSKFDRNAVNFWFYLYRGSIVYRFAKDNCWIGMFSLFCRALVGQQHEKGWSAQDVLSRKWVSLLFPLLTLVNQIPRQLIISN